MLDVQSASSDSTAQACEVPMTFTYTLDAAAFLKAFALHWRRFAVLSQVLRMVVVAAALGAWLYAGLSIGFWRLGYIMAFVVALMFYALFFARYTQRRNIRKQLGCLSQDQVVRCEGEIGADAVVIKGDTTVTTLKAEHVMRIREDESVMLLYRTPHYFYIIPKDQVADAIIGQIRTRLTKR